MKKVSPTPVEMALQRFLRSGIELERFHVLTYDHPHQTPLASARYHRVICVMEGRLHYVMPDGETDLQEGSWFYVPPWKKRQWRFSGAKTLRLAVCTFALSPDLPLLPYLAHAQDTTPNRREMFLSYFTPKNERTPALELRVEAFLKDTLCWIFLDGEFLREHGADDPSEEQILPFHAPSSEAMIQACERLAKNLHEPDALDQLLSSTTLSPGYFRAKFKEETGVTPREYHNELRMRRAHAMLFSGEFTVKETAFSCGFTDQLYFSRAYRKFWGVPPSVVEKTLG